MTPSEAVPALDPFRKKNGRLAERFLRSKAVLYKEDTSGLVMQEPGP